MISFFFFKQKTAYEMRISDWSSDVCSSDLADQITDLRRAAQQGACWRDGAKSCDRDRQGTPRGVATDERAAAADRALAQAGRETLQPENGRASCRERGCQYVEISVVDGSFTKNTRTIE